MAKYSKKAQDKIAEVMHEFKEGKLKSGPGGKGGKVKSRKQAIAIGISEAREAGAKVPEQKTEKSKK
jgi:PHP family Zn ribbon phosphoesterase